MAENVFLQIVNDQKAGKARGITSVCSAHPYVLRTAFRRGAAHHTPVLIEATCNQVNQFGGYTGMTPADFVPFIRTLAAQSGLAPEQLILGGDHLGPSVWQAQPAEIAMDNAEQLVRAYAAAGFVKIHIDASMRLGGDDPDHVLDVGLIASRTARLVKAAEEESTQLARFYVIGSEVPTPGGAMQPEERVTVTSPEAVQQTIEASCSAFDREGIGAAWERVMALVVQPGVEFGDDFILDYNPGGAQKLSRQIEAFPNLVYEAHSTDYQLRSALREMVKDHFAILKVGPALSYAFREMVFLLAFIEAELFTGERAHERSNLIRVVDDAMVKKPEDWEKYYRGTPDEQAFGRKFSLSDRMRYYWQVPQVQASLNVLFQNLDSVPIPLTLLSQFLPTQYLQVRSGSLHNDPHSLIFDHIGCILEDYEAACDRDHAR